ncbi:hypothetical protein [Myxococcus landrumensis]|uniref:SMI1/KNR4 family protein n=1 Tax=Myxococcus landrumensis TaxID=2813577 RepID=A0ABX7MZ76_9BACT|nr:hypothetical protein [Myxococcus landrumus]QSQ11658.1 hypothetical protein JY572_25065 [Myxococcus landrumus]
MPGIVTSWDTWCEEQTRAGFTAHQGAEPLTREQLERYEAAFWRRGFELGGGLRELLEARGIIWAASYECSDGSRIPGLRLPSDVRQLDDHDWHLELAERNGISNAAHWMLLTTEHGDVDSAWALDHRFGGASIGHYHQDLSGSPATEPTTPLPSASADFSTWFAQRLETLGARRQRLNRDDLVAWQDDLEAAPRRDEAAFMAEHAALLSMAEARVARGALPWNTLDVDWRRIASGTRDEALLRRVLEGVRKDRQKGRPGLPFELLAQGTDWPWDYPGPAQLTARLDVSSRQKVMGWALERAGGRSLGGQELHGAIDTLRGGDPGSRDLLRDVCASGWTERTLDLSTPSGRGRLLARAAALALSEPSENNVERVLTLCANVGAGAPGAWTLLDAWDHLDAVLTGRARPGEP